MKTDFILRWNSSPTALVDFTRCVLPSHLWNHSCEEEEEEQQVWRSHFTPFSVRPTAAKKLRWPSRLCFSFVFSCKSHRDWNTSKLCITDRLGTTPFQFLLRERPISVTVAGFLHPTNDWHVNIIFICEMLHFVGVKDNNEERTLVSGLHRDASSSQGGREVRHGGGGVTSEAWRVFLPNFDLTSVFPVCHPSFSAQELILSLKNRSENASSPERREGSEVMEAVLLWYVDWRDTTFHTGKKKKKLQESSHLDARSC